jgi:PAS domain S-box-containing protein
LGKKLLTDDHTNGHKTKLFKQLLQVIDTGSSFQAVEPINDNGEKSEIGNSYTRLGDGILVLQETQQGPNHSGKTSLAKKQNKNFNNEQLDGLEKRQPTPANFKLIIDSCMEAVVSYDLDGNIDYWNPAAVSIYGYTPEQATGKSIIDLIVPPDKKQEMKSIIGRIGSEGNSISDMKTQKIHKDGSTLHVLLKIFPLKDEQGNISGICSVTKDIGRENLAETQLREDSHFISQLAETSPDILYILDLETRQVIYSNRQVALDLGYSRQQMLAMKNPIFDIMHKEDVPAMIEHLKKMKSLADNQTIEIEYRLLTAQGEIKWYCDRNAVFKRNKRGVPVEKIGIAKDITEQKLKSEQANTLLDILSQAEAISGMGSWVYEIATGKFLWSTGMYHLFNLPLNTKVNPDIYLEYCADKDRQVVQTIINYITREFTSFEETITLLPPRGEEKIVKIKSIVQTDSRQNPVRMIGVDLDITEQSTSSQQIKQLNDKLTIKNRDLESMNVELRTFNRIAANDYKDTLQILYTNLEYIVSREARNLSDTSKANIRRAQSAVQKMKLLTEDINSYLELYETSMVLSMVDPNEILQHVIAILKRKIEQSEAVIETAKFPLLPSHPLLLSQLLSHLIDNAIKFRKLVSPPIIKIKYSQADEINAVPGAIKNIPYGIISVTDNGIGFNEEEADHVFDLFYRVHDKSKYKGSGIGLSICKKIMAMHEGFITAEGNPAYGATFSCYFPLR